MAPSETSWHHRPVVVVGRGHSGTRLLVAAIEALGVRLNLDSERRHTGDIQDRRFTKIIKTLARREVVRRWGDVPPRVPGAERALLAFALRRVQKTMSPGSLRWGWKFPETYLIPWHVDAVFPDARYVEIVRDGRDLAFKHHLTDDPHRKLGRAVLARARALDEPHHVQAARSWAMQVERFRAFASQRPDRVVTISFEQLCTDGAAVMTRVADLLELDMTDACAQLLAKAVNPAKIAQHRSEDPERIAEVERAIGDELARCGYADRAGPIAAR